MDFENQIPFFSDSTQSASPIEFSVMGDFTNGPMGSGQFLNILNQMSGIGGDAAKSMLPGLELFDSQSPMAAGSAMMGMIGGRIQSMIQMAGNFLPTIVQALPKIFPF